jgi:hypothetical protein
LIKREQAEETGGETRIPQAPALERQQSAAPRGYSINLTTDQFVPWWSGPSYLQYR